MTKWEDDIRRYYSGEMSPQEQHALEKKALSDPFLAEALEGAGLVSPLEFSDDLKDLTSKIDKRTQKLDDLQVAASAVKYASEQGSMNPSESKNKTHSPWIWPLRIAASIALIALVYFAITPLFENEKQLALQNTTDENQQQIDSIPEASLKKSDELIAKTETKISEKSTSKPEKVTEPIKPTEADLVSPSGAAAPALADRGEQEKEKISEDEVADVIVESQNAAEAKQPESKKEAAQVARAKSLSPAFSINQKIVQGKVVSAEDGTPLPGVNITVKGSNAGTVTDMQGNYQVISDTPDPTLVYSFTGMQTQEIKARDQIELTVKLQSDIDQLSEIVVTGYSPMKDDTNHEPVVKLAEPVGGRQAYDKYLKNSLHYPQQALDNKIKGRVIVQFIVRTDGSLDDFSVLNGLGYGCDEEVIRLVKVGPKWSPTIEDDVPVESKVQVRVKFAFPK